MKSLVPRPVYNYHIVFCQFVENGQTITYATKFFNRVEYLLPQSYAVFKIKLKDKRTFFEKVLDFGRFKKFWRKHGICSQVNKTIHATQPD